jgi:hypothetical protein
MLESQNQDISEVRTSLCKRSKEGKYICIILILFIIFLIIVGINKK